MKKKEAIRIYAFILALTIFIGLLGALSTLVAGASEEEKKVVYLTFDDGPSRNTERVLDILKKEGVHATFFIIKPLNEDDLKFTKRAFEEGNAIGNHTYDHDFKYVYSSKEAFWKTFNKNQESIESVTGSPSKLFRFPGGSKNSEAARRVGKQFNKDRIKELEAKGIHYFDWNVDCGDGMTDHASSSSIYNTIMRQVKGKKKAIILMHDSKNKNSTVEALPSVIQSLKKQGYTFDTLDNYYK